MTVEQKDVVDLVSRRKDGRTYALIMVEHRPWSADLDRLQQLADKATNYLTYALDGQMAREYPDSLGKRIVFQLDCERPPPPDVRSALESLAEQVRQYGIEFEVNPFRG